MNCEPVEERLSAYLDNMLTSDERREVTVHLQTCSRCMMSLAELRQNDILLAQLPRISPHPTLSQRLFSSPEVLELVGTTRNELSAFISAEWTRSLVPRRLSERESNPCRQLVSLPGGRGALPFVPDVPATPPTIILHPSSRRQQRRLRIWLTPLNVAISMLLVLVLGVVSLFGAGLYRSTARGSTLPGAITPPAAGPGTGPGEPLAAGTRFVFLRDDALWSTLVDSGDHQPERLTPVGVDVDVNWAVSPTLAGHTAGDMLAYIDLRGATVHTIRSDGQQDTSVMQPLLKAGIVPASIWETPTGETILGGLAWSTDGRVLAFVADPTGDGQTSLYLYSPATGQVQQVMLSLKGSISHPIWSPDSTRLAFELTHDGQISILDYNVLNQGVLELTNLAASQGDSQQSILSLNWLPGTNGPAVTWSLGTIGQVSSLWVHRVGEDGTLYPQLLLHGAYTQALYSSSGDNGVGSWVVVDKAGGQSEHVWRIDLTRGAEPVLLSIGKQVSLANWSSDGSSVFFMGQQTNGIGPGFIVNVATGATFSLTDDVAVNPSPVWSEDNQQLAYSTGNRINLVNAHNGKQLLQLHLQGNPVALSWSPAASHQLIVSLSDTAAGVYLVDTTSNTSRNLGSPGVDGQIQWTEIP